MQGFPNPLGRLFRTLPPPPRRGRSENSTARALFGGTRSRFQIGGGPTFLVQISTTKFICFQKRTLPHLLEPMLLPGPACSAAQNPRSLLRGSDLAAPSEGADATSTTRCALSRRFQRARDPHRIPFSSQEHLESTGVWEEERTQP